MSGTERGNLIEEAAVQKTEFLFCYFYLEKWEQKEDCRSVSEHILLSFT